MPTRPLGRPMGDGLPSRRWGESMRGVSMDARHSITKMWSMGTSLSLV
jgi:hypothetical protein